MIADGTNSPDIDIFVEGMDDLMASVESPESFVFDSMDSLQAQIEGLCRKIDELPQRIALEIAMSSAEAAEAGGAEATPDAGLIERIDTLAASVDALKSSIPEAQLDQRAVEGLMQFNTQLTNLPARIRESMTHSVNGLSREIFEAAKASKESLKDVSALLAKEISPVVGEAMAEAARRDALDTNIRYFLVCVFFCLAVFGFATFAPDDATHRIIPSFSTLAITVIAYSFLRRFALALRRLPLLGEVIWFLAGSGK